MPLTDQWQGFANLPDFPDPATIPTHLKQLFDFLADRAVPRYGSPAERDAELSSPTDGQMAWVDSDMKLYVSLAGSWRAVYEEPDPWHAITFENGWGSSFGGRYRKDVLGNLHIQARMDTVGTSSSSSAPAFTLPEGYRISYPTFLRVPLGTYTLATQADGYLFNDGRFAISTNLDPGQGYVVVALCMSIA